jgi:DNA-binding Lrp family transcriptional regulator
MTPAPRWLNDPGTGKGAAWAWCGRRGFRLRAASCQGAGRYTQGVRMRAIFVQIKCEMGQAYRVAREAADSIEELSELFSTSGQYDLLGKFYLDAEQDIGLFVTERIQTLPGVKDTYTLITFNAFGAGRG